MVMLVTNFTPISPAHSVLYKVTLSEDGQDHWLCSISSCDTTGMYGTVGVHIISNSASCPREYPL